MEWWAPQGLRKPGAAHRAPSERLALPTLRLEQLVGFERMPAEVARQLKVRGDDPCFAMELRGYTVKDRPLYLQRILGEPFEGASLLIDVNM